MKYYVHFKLKSGTSIFGPYDLKTAWQSAIRHMERDGNNWIKVRNHDEFPMWTGSKGETIEIKETR